MPIRAPNVVRDAIFARPVDALKVDFPDVDSVVNKFADMLRLGYNLPQIPIEPGGDVYMALLDYPPLKADGRRLFGLTYHATETCVVNPMSDPPCTYTLLTIRNVRGG